MIYPRLNQSLKRKNGYIFLRGQKKIGKHRKRSTILAIIF